MTLKFSKKTAAWFIADDAGTRVSKYYKKRLVAAHAMNTNTFDPPGTRGGCKPRQGTTRRGAGEPSLTERRIARAREEQAERVADAVSGAMIGVGHAQLSRRLRRLMDKTIGDIYKGKLPNVTTLADIALATGHELHIEFRPIPGGYLAAAGGSHEVVQQARKETLPGVLSSSSAVHEAGRAGKQDAVAA